VVGLGDLDGLAEGLGDVEAEPLGDADGDGDGVRQGFAGSDGQGDGVAAGELVGAASADAAGGDGVEVAWPGNAAANSAIAAARTTEEVASPPRTPRRGGWSDGLTLIVVGPRILISYAR